MKLNHPTIAQPWIIRDKDANNAQVAQFSTQKEAMQYYRQGKQEGRNLGVFYAHY